MWRLFLLAGLLATWAAHAETVRVAVARGPSLKVEGVSVRARTDVEAAWTPLGSVSEFQAVGPFASNGELLAARFELDGGEAPVRVGGVALLGQGALVATAASLVAVDAVELEAYVASVVGAEMSASWPAAALEAQAIAARTYVLRRKLATSAAEWDVEATVAHQVYRGGGSIDPRTRAAAEATRGLVLKAGGALAESYFFASCAGTTEAAVDAFGRGADSLQPVSCEGGEAAPKLAWERRLPVAQVSKVLEAAGILGDPLVRIEAVAATRGGRVKTARLVTRHSSRLIGGPELRQAIGFSELPSLDVTFSVDGDDLVMKGRGAGHGVGLCQWCARGRALKGEDARAILSHFYPGTVAAPAF